jgi:HSP20 family protein
MNQEKKIILSKIIEQKEEGFSKGSLGQKKRESDFFKKDEEGEGQLLVDVYRRGDNVIVKTIVAGVKPEDIDISLKNDIITLRGKRFLGEEVLEEDYYCSECYWGRFSRSIVLPFKIDEKKLEATLKNGILTIILPKAKISRTQNIKIKEVD